MHFVSFGFSTATGTLNLTVPVGPAASADIRNLGIRRCLTDYTSFFMQVTDSAAISDLRTA
jgi:hypothetical protein